MDQKGVSKVTFIALAVSIVFILLFAWYFQLGGKTMIDSWQNAPVGIPENLKSLSDPAIRQGVVAENVKVALYALAAKQSFSSREVNADSVTEYSSRTILEGYVDRTKRESLLEGKTDETTNENGAEKKASYSTELLFSKGFFEKNSGEAPSKEEISNVSWNSENADVLGWALGLLENNNFTFTEDTAANGSGYYTIKIVFSDKDFDNASAVLWVKKDNLLVEKIESNYSTEKENFSSQEHGEYIISNKIEIDSGGNLSAVGNDTEIFEIKPVSKETIKKKIEDAKKEKETEPDEWEFVEGSNPGGGDDSDGGDGGDGGDSGDTGCTTSADCTGGQSCCSGTCAGLACLTDAGCNDSISATLDACLFPGTCASSCSHTLITACTNGDGYCPVGCTLLNDSDCPASCGNGSIDTGETCSNCPAEVVCAFGTLCCNNSCSAPACSSDDQCNDNDACTTDTCNSAGGCSSSCSHTAIDNCGGDGGDGDDGGDTGCTTNGNCTGGQICCSTACTDPFCTANIDCDDSASSTLDTCLFPGTCNASCSHTTITQCTNDDGYCPAGCTSANDNDCLATCGNGSVDSGETCGTCPADVTCNIGMICCNDSCSVSLCSSDSQCNSDNDPCTADTCDNAGSCIASCSYPTIPSCGGDDGDGEVNCGALGQICCGSSGEPASCDSGLFCNASLHCTDTETENCGDSGDECCEKIDTIGAPPISFCETSLYCLGSGVCSPNPCGEGYVFKDGRCCMVVTQYNWDISKNC